MSRATRSRRRCGSNRRCPYAGRRAGRGSRRWRAARGDPQTFVSEASAAGVAEIEAGKMALEKSTAADVKVFAKQMIDDHGKVNAELRSLAERKKLEVEDDASLTDKAKATLLDLRDASFDPAYANNQVAAHEKAVELFTQAADNLTDPELQAFAKTHLPALKHHLEMARALAKAHPSK
nr:DUF4142 domain-containing protein [Pseudomonas aeruginosa]